MAVGGAAAFVLILGAVFLFGGDGETGDQVEARDDAGEEASAEDPQLAEAERLLSEAQEYAEANPEDWPEIRRRFEEATEAAFDTSLHYDASVAKQEAERDYRQAAEEAYQELDRRIDGLMDDERFEEALAAIDSYPEVYRETNYWLRHLQSLKRSIQDRIERERRIESAVVPDPGGDDGPDPGPSGPTTPTSDELEGEGSGRFVASKSNRQFHRPECRQARRISSSDVFRFPTPADAIEAGFAPCIECRPEDR